MPAEALSRLGTTRLRYDGRVAAMQFTPDGKSLLADDTMGVRLWDVATGKQVRVVAEGPPTNRFRQTNACLSPEGK